MNRADRRARNRQTAMGARQRYGPNLERVARDQWPPGPWDPVPIEVWASRTWIVLVFTEVSETVTHRISVRRADGRADITWNDLLAIKDDIGYGTSWAVEIFPPVRHLVDDANMRHLWLLRAEPDYGWRR